MVLAVFGLAFLYQALLLALLALTSGVGLISVPFGSLALRAVNDTFAQRVRRVSLSPPWSVACTHHRIHLAET